MTPGKELKRTLLTGLLVVAPIVLSLTLLAWAVYFLDHLLAPVIATLFGRHVPGLGLIAGLLILLGVGLLSGNIVGHHLVELLEEFLLRVPVLNWLYRTAKQLAEVFAPEGQAKFQRVVLVEYPRPGVFSLGFVTRELALERHGNGAQPLAAVYVPTNHLYIGDTVLVPRASLLETGLSLQEGIQSVISAGASLPPSLPLPPKA